MRKLVLLSLMIMSGLFWACEKDDSSSSYDFALTDSEHKAVTEWNILVSGGNKSLSLEAPDAWTLQVEYLSGGEGWLIASPTSGKAGVTTLNLSVGRNASYTDERKANVKITCGSQTKTLTVTQSARDGVVVEPLQHELNYRDTVIMVHVAANIGYEYQIIQSGDPWITEVTGTESKAAMEETDLSFMVAANSRSRDRSATIEFVADNGETVEVAITQKGQPLSDVEYYAMYEGTDIMGNVQYVQLDAATIDAWFMKSTPTKVQNEPHMYNGTGWWYAILDNTDNRHWGSEQYDFAEGTWGMRFKATIAYAELCLRGFGGGAVTATLYAWDADYATTIAKKPIMTVPYTGDGSNDWWFYVTDNATHLPAGDYLILFAGDAGTGIWGTPEEADDIAEGFLNGESTERFISLSYNGVYAEHGTSGFASYVAQDYTDIVRVRSTDGGKSWGTPVSVYSLNKAKLDATYELQWAKNIVITQASNGTYYAALSTDGENKKIVLASSATYEEDWTIVADKVVSGVTVSSLIEVDGTLYLYYIKNHNIYVATSSVSEINFVEQGLVYEANDWVKNVSVVYDAAAKQFVMIYALDDQLHNCISTDGIEPFAEGKIIVEEMAHTGVTYVDYVADVHRNIPSSDIWVGYICGTGAYAMPVF